MKIIFLDMDGVMNNHQVFSTNSTKHNDHLNEGERDNCTCWTLENQVDPACVERLNKIIDATDTKIVISSSWRKVCDVDEMRRILGMHGLKQPACIIDQTPDLANDEAWVRAWRDAEDRAFREKHGRERKFPYIRIERGLEIREWLLKNPHVTHFVILDDSGDMAMLKPWHLQTDEIIGLLDEHINRVFELLEASPEGLALIRGERT